jgi:uncharacterized membrane protein
VTKRGRQVIEGVYPDPLGEELPSEPSPAVSQASGRDVRWPKQQAVLQTINVPPLIRRAEQAGVVIQMRVAIGETVQENAVVATIYGEGDAALSREVVKQLSVGTERTFEQDPALAFRVLADIALRALSPALNQSHAGVKGVAYEALLTNLACLT